MKTEHHPFTLSLSKGCPSFGTEEEVEMQGFDKLSPNGEGAAQ